MLRRVRCGCDFGLLCKGIGLRHQSNNAIESKTICHAIKRESKALVMLQAMQRQCKGNAKALRKHCIIESLLNGIIRNK